MELIIAGKNLQISDALEEYVRKKVNKLDRFVAGTAETRVELSTESTRTPQQRKVVQVTIYKNGSILRAEERASDMKAAVDLVVDKMERQIRRFKDKRMSKRVPKKGHAGAAKAAAEEASSIESEPHIVRVKRFLTPPMDADEAIEQMELLGHSFFVFLNAATSELNVVYRRQDETYGVLEPEMNPAEK